MTDRGQTTLDFAIGISVFLITAVFVFGFVPGLLQPFNQGAQEETVAADRVASQLAQGSLANPEDPYILNTGCTVDFFQADPSAAPNPTGCAFDQSVDLTSGGSLTDRIGLAPRQRVNVTIEGDTDGGANERLCWDHNGGSGKIVESSDTNCGDESADVPLAVGEPVPSESQSVVSARRVVSIDGYDAALIVRMW